MTDSTSSKHTPGPWELCGGNIEARGVRLAVVDRPVDDAGNENAGLDWDEALGNATLIRSLPELIAERDALRADNARLIAALRKYHSEHFPGTGTTPEAIADRELYAQARAALAGRE